MPSLPDASHRLEDFCCGVEKLHPVATGPAVAAHQAPQSLEFCSGYRLLVRNSSIRWFCPFVQRAWIALEEGRPPYQYKEVNPYKEVSRQLRHL